MWMVLKCWFSLTPALVSNSTRGLLASSLYQGAGRWLALFTPIRRSFRYRLLLARLSHRSVPRALATGFVWANLDVQTF